MWALCIHQRREARERLNCSRDPDETISLRAFIFYVRALEINWLRLASIQPEGRSRRPPTDNLYETKAAALPAEGRRNLLDLMKAQSGYGGEIYVTTAGTPEIRPDHPVKATCCATGAAVCGEESC